MVADNVVVVAEVSQHLGVAALAVAQSEAVLDVDGIAGPVERGRLSQERPSAAVEHAADNLVFRVIVRRTRIIAGVEAGKPSRSLDESFVVRIGECLIHEGRDSLGIVQPIEGNGKLLVVHTLAGDLDFDSAGRSVLPQMPFPRLLVKRKHAVGRAQRVQQRPIGQALDGVVRAIVAPPALDAFQVAAIVKVMVVVHVAGRRRRAQ